jgi:NAD(P)-dependent dehydrogenase (short-subunit alcohol dehydrogenase family)/acyl carrier protein
VLSLADALKLVARRAQLIEALPGGAMLGVPLSEQEVQPLLGAELSLSAINGPRVCVLAGPETAIAELERSLLAQEVACRRVSSSHAFHSKMLDPIVAPLTALVGTFELQPPQIPYVSNLTGTWITDEQATDARYWGRHSRHPVRFADGIGELWRDPDGVLLEVGPGHTLSTMALQHPAGGEALEQVLSTIRHAYEPQADEECLLNALGQLWMLGVPLDWQAFHGGERRLRVPLPTYPFERQRYWIEPGQGGLARPDPLVKRADVADWFYIPSWKRSVPPLREARKVSGRWLVFDDGGSLSEGLIRRLVAQGGQVVVVRAGARFAADEDGYTLDPARREDYEALLAALDERRQLPDQIVHLWNVAPPDEKDPAEKALLRGFYSLLFLAQALEKRELDKLQIAVVSSNMQRVADEEVVYAEKAPLLGPCRVISQELPNVVCRSIDAVMPKSGSRQEAQLAEYLIAEIEIGTPDSIIAYRKYDRWVQTYEPVQLPQVKEGMHRVLRKRGVYLITGGLSEIGLTLAQHLARTAQARLVLLTRLRLPEREIWEQEIAARDPQDPVSLRIRAMQELQALGAEVLLLRADVTNPSQVEKALRLVREQYGTIHGVIHAADARSGAPICSETPSSVDSALGFKVNGTRVLAAALQDAPLDFLVLCSSLTALVGGTGRVVHCAANAFLDAFAQMRYTQNGSSALSINWGAWEVDEREKVMEAFDRILAHNHLPQIAVCSRHLPTLVAQSVKWDTAHPVGAEDEVQAVGTEHPRPNLPTTYAAPSSEVEEKLAGIWQRLLGIGKVGRNDSFFRLGGHSLVAIQLINRVRDTFEVEMDLRASFEAPTIAELAERIQQAQQSAREVPVPPLAPLAREGALPLSLVQQQRWLLGREPDRGGGLRRRLASLRRARAPKVATHTPERDDRASNLVATLHLDGKLDRAALEQSLDEVVRRHETLRTTFATVNGQPVQVFALAAAVALSVLDLSDWPESERETRLQQVVTQEAQHTFDLLHGPPWRVTLIELSSETHVLLLNLHRIVADERSVELFVQELALCYEAFCAGGSAALPELPLQYADYAAWQWTWLQSGALQTQLAYWRQQLDNSPPELKLPVRSLRPAAPDLSKRQPFTLSQELTEGLRKLSQAQGGTLFMTLLAAFKSLLHGYTGQTDVVVGAPVVNRQRSEIEDLIGPFGNTLVLRTDLGGNPTFSELLERVREVTLGAYAHQDLPYEMLVGELGRSFLCQVLFVLQNEPLETLTLPELTLSALEMDEWGSGVDLTLTLQDAQEGLQGALAYNAASFDEAIIARLVEHYRTLLEHIVADPQQRLADLGEFIIGSFTTQPIA